MSCYKKLQLTNKLFASIFLISVHNHKLDFKPRSQTRSHLYIICLLGVFIAIQDIICMWNPWPFVIFHDSFGFTQRTSPANGVCVTPTPTFDSRFPSPFVVQNSVFRYKLMTATFRQFVQSHWSNIKIWKRPNQQCHVSSSISKPGLLFDNGYATTFVSVFVFNSVKTIFVILILLS